MLEDYKDFFNEVKRFNLLFLNFGDMPPDPLKGPISRPEKIFGHPAFKMEL